MIIAGSTVRERVAKMPGWDMEKGNLKKIYQFKSFKQSIHFVNQVAYVAEKVNHHPDILVRYDAVVISVMTHDENGITEKDFRLAGEIDKIISNTP